MTPFLSSLIFVLIVSLISLVGIFLGVNSIKNISRLTLYLVAFAVGTLLGDAFFHLIPESFEQLSSPLVSWLVISGLLLFFILEKILRWRHCHEIDCPDDHSPVITLNVLGDSVHNFIDGMIIASSFSVSWELGLATSLAVIFHEIPQEIGDFAILLHHGVALKRALFLNFISALFAVFGVLTTFLLSQHITHLNQYLLPITAGGFIYLAASDLIPELHRHDPKISLSLTQLLLILIGVFLMSLLLALE